MNDMFKDDPFHEYAKCKAVILKMQNRMEELKPTLMKKLENEEDGKKQYGFGTFTLRENRWVYSSKVEQLKKETRQSIKEAQDEEIKQGIAKTEEITKFKFIRRRQHA